MTRTATHRETLVFDPFAKGLLILLMGILIGISIPAPHLSEFRDPYTEKVTPMIEDWHGNVRRSHY